MAISGKWPPLVRSFLMRSWSRPSNSQMADSAPDERARSVEMGRKFYVGNLPYETGEPELQELFGQCGSVDTVRIMRDMATGRARGFGFVEMSTDEEAQTAIAKLNQYQLGGRALVVNESRRKAEYARGGFGSGSDAGGGRRRSEPRW
jgi:RNA recognition motif-containing protein